MSKLSVFGIIATTIYFACGGTLIHLQFDDFSALDPNEWGDFLAGSLGPLALFWLILGFFQQGIELRHSVQALNIQAEELKNSVEQQKIMSATAKSSFESDEKMREAQLEAIHRQRSPYLRVTLLNINGDGVGEIKLRNIGAHSDIISIKSRENIDFDAIAITGLGPDEEATVFLKVRNRSSSSNFIINSQNNDAYLTSQGFILTENNLVCSSVVYKRNIEKS
ncbi:MAG: hypothetical protein ACU0B9_03470 [Limimaricola soesokkakensis]|uniref:hypothetical protein n=1 Tax=Limimaricola soesokkakensis TaxID=1343159 RepID=UPI00405A10AD